MVTIGLESVDIVNNIGQILKEILVDCKKNRKQFIFPTFPIKEASVPSITLEVIDEKPTPEAADNFLEEVVTTNQIKRYRYHIVEATLKLYFFTSRQDIDNSYLINGNTYTMNNKLANKAYSSYVWKTIIQNRDKFIPKLREITMTGVDYSFEDGPNFWTSEMSFDISYQTIWCDTFDKNTGKLVNSYTLTIDVTKI